jgi:hypothetical protein
MAGIVKGRLLVALSNSNADNNTRWVENARQMYRSVYDFLKVQVEPAGYVTEIANNGTTNDSTTHGGFSVWRWNTSSNRSWEWYMLMTLAQNGSAGADQLPAEIEDTSINSTRAVGFAAAVGIQATPSGSVYSYTFFNPWEGATGSLGSDPKGNPVWGTGSAPVPQPGAENHVATFPRSNIQNSRIHGTIGSSTVRTNKADMSRITSAAPESEVVCNMWADEDAFLVTAKEHDRHDHGHVFIGPYTPFPLLTASIPAPLIMYRHTYDSGFDLFSSHDLEYYASTGTGAVSSVFPLTNSLSSSELFNPTCGYMFLKYTNFDIQPNKQAQIALGSSSSFYDQSPVFIYRAERPFGTLGIFDNQLLRHLDGVGGDTLSRYATTNSGSDQTRKAFFPASNTTEDANTYSVIWSGSFLPGTGSGFFVDISGAFTF